jgi:cytidylate kinase
MKRTVVCVSHATGSGGADLGRAVAEKLGFRLIDEEVISRAAEAQKVSVEELADAERRRSLLERILHDVAFGAAAAGYDMTAVMAPTDMLDQNSLRGLIRRSIEEIADEGNVVIVSHAASHALADRDDVLRVLVTASPAVRTSRLVGAGLSEKDAAKSISANDAGRASYLKRFYGVSEELPTHYDLTVNTDRIGAEEWSDLVVGAASS